MSNKYKKGNKKKMVCEACYPNLTACPVTVKIEKIPRYPPYLQPRIKPLDFDELFPKLNQQPSTQGSQGLPTSQSPIPAEIVNCEKCLKILREKEFQLIRLEQELAQVRARYGSGGARHNYKGVRGLEYQLYLKDQEIARLKMEEAKRLKTLREPELQTPTCVDCSGYLRRKQLQLREIEPDIVRQMASPYVKISPNPCDCCNEAAAGIRESNEKSRKKNRHNCFKELQKRERNLKKREKDIDKKIKRFRKNVLDEAKADMAKVPDPNKLIRNVILKCKCACQRRNVFNKNFDPCSYDPNALGGSLPCSVPCWNSIAPREHTCTTKCCVTKLLENLVTCAFRPPGGWKKRNKKDPTETCIAMRLMRWWVGK